MDVRPDVNDFQENDADGTSPGGIPPAPAAIRKRSVTLAGHATSVSLEDAFWQALGEIAAERGLSLNALVAEIDGLRAGNLSSACRVHVLEWLRGRLSDP